jgi:hypothetical protein
MKIRLNTSTTPLGKTLAAAQRESDNQGFIIRHLYRIANKCKISSLKRIVNNHRANRQQKFIKHLHSPEVADKMRNDTLMKTLPMSQRNFDIANHLAMAQAKRESKREFLIEACRTALMNEGHSSGQLEQNRSAEHFADLLLKHSGKLIDWSAGINPLNQQIQSLIQDRTPLQEKLIRELSASVANPTEPLKLDLLTALCTSLEMDKSFKTDTTEKLKSALTKFDKDEKLFLKNSLMLHHDLRDIVTLFSKESDVSAIKAELSSIKQNTGEQWIADMQQSATNLIKLVEIIENNLAKDKPDDRKIFKASDWVQKLTSSVVENKLQFMSPALRQDFETKTGFKIKDKDNDHQYWKTITDSIEIKPDVYNPNDFEALNFEPNTIHRDLDNQFVIDIHRSNIKVKGNLIVGSNEDRIEQFKTTINNPELMKVISQYANQTPSNKINDFIAGQFFNNALVPDGNNPTQVLNDFREVTDDRIVITISRRLQIGYMLTPEGDMIEPPNGSLNPCWYQFNLTLTRNQNNEWYPKISNITGAYRVISAE